MGDGVANAPHRTASTDDDDVGRIRHLLGYLRPSKPKAGVVDVLRGGRGDGLAQEKRKPPEGPSATPRR